MISVVSMEGAEQTRGPAYLEPEAFQAEGLGFRTFTYSLAPDFRFASCLCFENQRHSILSSLSSTIFRACATGLGKRVVSSASLNKTATVLHDSVLCI